MSLSSDLIAQAESLRDADPRRPNIANLRRAVSAAYYAVFQHIIDSCAQMLAGTQLGDRPVANLVARAFTHGTMYTAFRTLVNSKQPPDLVKTIWTANQVPTNSHLRTVANHFISLQADRHAADYDLNASYVRSEVSAIIQQAKQAILSWDQLCSSHREVALIASLTLLLWKQLQNR